MVDLVKWFKQLTHDVISLIYAGMSTFADWCWDRLIDFLSKEDGTGDRW